MPAVPGTITLTQPADLSLATASDQRNDHTSIQTAVNGLIAWANGLSGSTTYRKTTSKTVNTTVTATDLLNGEITIAAGAMATAGTLRLTASGDWLQNSGGTAAPPRLQLVLGGTTVLDTGTSGTAAADATRRGWELHATILNLGVTNSQTSRMWVVGGMNVSGATSNAFTTGEGVYKTASGGAGTDHLQAQGVNLATAVDTTVSCPLLLKVINGSANAAYETKLFGALVEII